jgi:hypothetical protein
MAVAAAMPVSVSVSVSEEREWGAVIEGLVLEVYVRMDVS